MTENPTEPALPRWTALFGVHVIPAPAGATRTAAVSTLAGTFAIPLDDGSPAGRR